MVFDLGKGKSCLKCHKQLCTCERDVNGKPLWIVDVADITALKTRITTLEVDNEILKTKVATLEAKVK